MMIRTVRQIAVAGCSLLLLTQCATQDEVQNLQYQLRAVNQKVEDVKSNTVGQMQKRQASSVSKLDQVEDETLRIKSSVEENIAQNNQFRDQINQNFSKLQTSVDTVKSDHGAKIAELNQKVAVLEEKLALVSENFSKVQQERIAEAEKRAKEAAQRAEAAKQKAAQATAAATTPAVTPIPPLPAASQSAGTTATGMVKVGPDAKKTKVATATPAAPPEPATTKKAAEPPKEQAPAAATTTTATAAPAPTTAKAPAPEKATAPAEKATGSDPFSQGMSQFKDKKYKEAYKSFEQSLAANPNGSQAAKSLYYMGESLYNQGEYDLAILDYQKVISNHGKDPLTPGALLKQGMSFEKLTDQETAKIIYKKLINDHGGSSEAAQAKERLSKL